MKPEINLSELGEHSTTHCLDIPDATRQANWYRSRYKTVIQNGLTIYVSHELKQQKPKKH